MIGTWEFPDLTGFARPELRHCPFCGDCGIFTVTECGRWFVGCCNYESCTAAKLNGPFERAELAAMFWNHRA